MRKEIDDPFDLGDDRPKQIEERTAGERRAFIAAAIGLFGEDLQVFTGYPIVNAVTLKRVPPLFEEGDVLLQLRVGQLLCVIRADRLRFDVARYKPTNRKSRAGIGLGDVGEFMVENPPTLLGPQINVVA